MAIVAGPGCFGQIAPPYYSNFDQVADTAGWKHYSLSGTDDWVWGAPIGNQLSWALSGQKVWKTTAYANGVWAINSERCLESPSFDLSSLTTIYRLTFAHQYDMNTTSGANVEYSTDNGLTWILLDGLPADKQDWYTSTSTACTGTNAAWSSFYPNLYKFSMHNLSFLAGQANVKFRFRLCSTGSTSEGWMIDNFSVEENKPNIYCSPKSIDHASKYCTSFNLTTQMVYNQWGFTTFTNVINYYLSTDTILTAADTLLNSISSNWGSTFVNWNNTLSLPPAYTTAGTKYIFVTFDSGNTLAESNENDNSCMFKLIVDSILPAPLVSSLENGPMWTTSNSNQWVLGAGNNYLYENTHSGANAYFNLNNNPIVYQTSYLESPLFDSQLEDSTIISFWYVSKSYLVNAGTQGPIQFSQGCPSNSSSGVIGGIPAIAAHAWGYVNHYLPQAADTSRNARIRIINGVGYAFPTNNFQSYDLLIDDIYIGRAKADLNIECDTKNRYTATSDVSDTLKYTLVNSGLKSCLASSTAFYWSTDSLLDSGDLFLGFKPEPSMAASSSVTSQFIYTKPGTATGRFYVLYLLDSMQTVDEMRDYNNTGYFTLHQDAKQTYPYINDFESQITGWRHNASFHKDEWTWTAPSKPEISGAFSGSKAWLTNDTGFVSPKSRMHLYSPIFDLTSAIRPTLEFDMLMPSSANTFPIDMNMSYSTDNGATWTVLDTLGRSFNRWYYFMGYDASGGIDGATMGQASGNFYDATEPVFVSSASYNGRDCKRIHRYILDIKRFAGINKIQFRFNIASNQATSNMYYASQGAMVDNFMLREGNPELFFDYKKSLMLSSNSNVITLNGQVKNGGNYVANPGLLQFYVSTDSVYSANDVLLGTSTYTYTRPDNYAYFNKRFASPLNFNTYKYVIIRCDASNTTAEINESNNDVAWPLALDSLVNAQYFNNFNDTVVDGWFGYSIYNNAIYGHRVRNQVPPAGNLFQFWYRSGELFTDQVESGSWNPDPTFYIQSPKFDFSGSLNVDLSFKLMCTGAANTSGGIMEYSTDGGNTFQYLNLNSASQTPYNYFLSNFGVNGWAGQIGLNPQMNYAPVQANVSFLAGQGDVVFRFKYRSNHYFSPGSAHGIRIDDFSVGVTKIDYKANDFNVILTAPVNNNSITVNYSYTYNELFYCPATTIRFYWSADSVLNTNTDVLLGTKNVLPATGILVKSDSIAVDLSSVNFSGLGYLFYKIDPTDLLVESSENNNVGSFIITNYVGFKKQYAAQIVAYVSAQNLYARCSGQSPENPYKLTVTDDLGRRVFENEIQLQKEMTTVPLPQWLAKGLYYVTLSNKTSHITLRYVVE